MNRRDQIRSGGRAIKDSRAQKSPKISNYLFIFGCLCGGLAEYEDPGRRSKIFPNLKARAVLKR